jgi:hypothetical protein
MGEGFCRSRIAPAAPIKTMPFRTRARLGGSGVTVIAGASLVQVPGTPLFPAVASARYLHCANPPPRQVSRTVVEFAVAESKASGAAGMSTVSI